MRQMYYVYAVLSVFRSPIQVINFAGVNYQEKQFGEDYHKILHLKQMS